MLVGGVSLYALVLFAGSVMGMPSSIAWFLCFVCCFLVFFCLFWVFFVCFVCCTRWANPRGDQQSTRGPRSHARTTGRHRGRGGRSHAISRSRELRCRTANGDRLVS